MELYRLIATCNNGTPSERTFDYLPENFEGVKIGQSFSFVNPIGYTPKFSIDTMRVIASDKVAIDAIFLQNGLESDVVIEIQKLDATGTYYEYLATFAIDFESYEMFDDYSEFALKSVSVIDYYNNVKNTEKQYTLAAEATLPNTQQFINYVSLKSKTFIQPSDFVLVPSLMKNNDAKIYNGDTSLLTSPFTGGSADNSIYRFSQNTTSTINISATANVYLYTEGTITVKLCKNSTNTPILTIGSYTFPGADFLSFNYTGSIASSSYSAGDNLFLAIFCESGTYLEYHVGGLTIDIKLNTNNLVVNSTGEKIKYISATDILNDIFNNNIIIPTDAVYDFGLTSANQISKLNDFANVKPKEFLSDFCLATGSILNFKKDGGVVIGLMADYFDLLFDVDDDDVPKNFIPISDFKDLSVRYNVELNFSSVEAGKEISDYDIYTYFIDWNKKLTFSQIGRNAAENLDLTLQKFRVDFSGMLDYFYKRSKQQQKTSKDNFLFDPNFTAITGTDASIKLYDNFTPRNILTNWNKFLSFCFQNFSLDTLIISSNGGNSDNLAISGVNQMDDVVLNSTPRLLPVEYNFTCLIDDVDFSEKILKINDNGTDVYLFVINAETMDTFSEQKIRALKIEFPN